MRARLLPRRGIEHAGLVIPGGHPHTEVTVLGDVEGVPTVEFAESPCLEVVRGASEGNRLIEVIESGNLFFTARTMRINKDGSIRKGDGAGKHISTMAHEAVV